MAVRRGDIKEIFGAVSEVSGALREYFHCPFEYTVSKGVEIMGKLKSLLIGAMALCCVILSGTSTAAGGLLRGAVYLSAGVTDLSLVSSESADNESGTYSGTSSEPKYSQPSSESAVTDSLPNEESVPGGPTSDSEPTAVPPGQTRGSVITRNRADGTDDTDYSAFTKNSGAVYRYNFGYYSDPNIITLSSGAQVRNCTDIPNSELLSASAELPDLRAGAADGEPQVLIYHTHTSESFLPYGNSYDKDYPIRSSDPAKNMIAVGDKICEALAARGVSVIHDCRVHDYPVFTGAYYRSADTLLEVLKEYPSIKIAIDIHRDGIINSDGSVTAPTANINGRTAAQLMIISCCDSPDTPIPNYIDNFKTACVIQNCAETAYPGLTRPILFDCRNYNQPLFGGCVLIEVGSQGNSLDEALYTGELLGHALADAFGC